jgi:hypothetical protein
MLRSSRRCDELLNHQAGATPNPVLHLSDTGVERLTEDAVAVWFAGWTRSGPMTRDPSAARDGPTCAMVTR